MKLRDSLAENNSIRLQTEANTGRKPSRSASIYWWLPTWWSRAITVPFSMALSSLAPIL